MEWSAPAKINLSLEIKGRREDGFHELETLMCPVSVYDRIAIEKAGAGGLDFRCTDPTLPTGEDNLVVRAVRIFCAEAGLTPDLRIVLEKGIPHGAGLGGGSSDAATVLLALNELYGAGFSTDVLSAMAASLGSDIPFFIYRSAAACRGRGELVTPVEGPKDLPLLLIKPPFGVPTPWAYKRWKDSLEIPGIEYGAQKFAWGTLVNDLERPVFEKYLMLASLKKWLMEQEEVEGALMSGSGSTVFAVLRREAAAAGLRNRLQQVFGESLWLAECVTL